MAKSTRNHFQEIFSQSQNSVTSHERLFKQLKQLYDKISPDVFLREFTRCLQIPLFHGEKLRNVENSLNFASKFIASLLQMKPVNADQSVDEEDEEICPFVLNVLRFLFENHNTEHQAIRFRVCQFINKVLNGLGNEACIDDNLCDQISECMMERLQDKAASVRMQAVLALHRLQDPTDVNCPVMKAFIFHMSADPNPDVRRAVITNIAVTAQSVRAILERTHDSKDSVRRTAYVSLSKLGVQRFTIIQRVRLLTDGLKDPSAIVRDCVSKVMLPAWLQFYKGSFLSLLHALDCENSTETSSLALQALFKSQPIKAVLEELTKLLNEDGVIPVKDLSPENVLYWRVLHEYLEAHPEIADERPVDEPLPELLPELSTFCNYMKMYFEEKSIEEAEHWVKLQHQYILIQLLELCKIYDLADEMGRTNLRNLCLHFLTNDAVSEDLVPVVVQVLVRVIPDVEECLQALAEAISEVREPMTDQEPQSIPAAAPALSAKELRQKELKQASIRVKINELQEEKDDAIRGEDFQRAQELKEEYEKLQVELQALTETLACPPPPPPPPRPQNEVRDVVKDERALQKCLRIVREMVQPDSVKSLSATLRSLMQNFVLPCLQEDNSSVIRNKALECLGLFCLLDRTLAKENFLMFCFQIANDEVCEVALKVTFDLLLLYGLETFQIEEDTGEASDKKKSKKKKNLFVTDMFDEEFDTEEEEGQESLSNISSGSSGSTKNLISLLTSLLDSASTSMRNLAMEGLYKLLHACRITSSALLSRLILMWYSPVTDGDEALRQPLGVFLTVYASHCPRSQETFEQAFLPTLRTLMQAPVTSPLTQIDQDSVARLFTSLTRPGLNKFHSEMSPIHNNMALSICNAIMDCDDCTNIGVFLRALTSLELSLDDPIYREELKTLVIRARDIFTVSKEKQFKRYLDKIHQMIESAAEIVSMRTTEVDNTAASSHLEGTHGGASIDNTVDSDIQETIKRNKKAKLLHPRMHSILAENQVLEEEEEDEDSQKSPLVTSSLIIPASPPRSQSSDSEEEDFADSASEDKTSKGAQSNEKRGRNKAVTNSANDDVFKKPATKGKPQRGRDRDQQRTALSSDADASPVAKRRKAAENKDQESSNSSRSGRGRVARNHSCEIEDNLAVRNKAEEKQKSTNPPSKRNVRGVNKDDSEKDVSAKRHINPTEKGASLKTFQNISAAQLAGSPTSTPPAKRLKKSAPKQASTSKFDIDISTFAQISETSDHASPRKSSPVRPSTRRSVSFLTDSDSLESSPVSANELRANVRKRAEKSKCDEKTSDLSSPTLRSSYRHGSDPSKDGKKTDKKSGQSVSSSSSGHGADSDSSPLPRSTRQAKSNPTQKRVELHSRSTRPKADSDASPTPPTGSGRLWKGASPTKHPKQSSKIHGSGSTATDSDLSPLPAPKKKSDALSPRQPVSRSKRVIPSSKPPGTDVASDASPVACNLQQGKQGLKLDGIEKIPDKSTKSMPSRSTRRSVSKSDTEGTQGNGISSSEQSENVSPAPRSSRRNIVPSEVEGQSFESPLSATHLKHMLMKTVEPAGIRKIRHNEKESNSNDSSPARRSSKGQHGQSTEIQLLTDKKRPAPALKSTSTENSDADSPEPTSRVGRGRAKTKEKSTPTQPEKKTRNKTPSKDSPVPGPSRRSLRSQVETPSPRTRSGKK